MTNKIGSFFKKLADDILDGIKKLFVPDEDYFSNSVGDMQDSLKRKMPIISQILELMNRLINEAGEASEAEPSFSFTMYGTDVSLIDFSIYSQYRTYIHSIVLAVSYAFFIRSLIRRVPKAIGGIT